MLDDILSEINNKIQNEEIKSSLRISIRNAYNLMDISERLNAILQNSDISEARSAIFNEFQNHTMDGIQAFFEWDVARPKYDELVSYRDAYNDLSSNLGRTPSYDELAQALGNGWVSHVENDGWSHDGIDFTSRLDDLTQQIVADGYRAFGEYRDHLAIECNESLSSLFEAYNNYSNSIIRATDGRSNPAFSDRVDIINRVVNDNSRAMTITSRAIQNMITYMDNSNLELDSENSRIAAAQFGRGRVRDIDPQNQAAGQSDDNGGSNNNGGNSSNDDENKRDVNHAGNGSQDSSDSKNGDSGNSSDDENDLDDEDKIKHTGDGSQDSNDSKNGDSGNSSDDENDLDDPVAKRGGSTSPEIFSLNDSRGRVPGLDDLEKLIQQLEDLRGQRNWYVDIVASIRVNIENADPANSARLSALNSRLATDQRQLQIIEATIISLETRIKDLRNAIILDYKNRLYGSATDRGLIFQLRNYEDQFLNAGLHSGRLDESQLIEFRRLDILIKTNSKKITEEEKVRYKFYRRTLISIGISFFARETAMITEYENLLVLIGDMEDTLRKLLDDRARDDDKNKQNDKVKPDPKPQPDPDNTKMTPVPEPQPVPQPVNSEFKVTFDSNGGKWPDNDTIKVQTVAAGDCVVRVSPDPALDDSHEFGIWELDGEPFDFTKPINSDITLKAKYKEKKLQNPQPVPPKKDEDGIFVTFMGRDGVEYDKVPFESGEYCYNTPVYDKNHKPIRKPLISKDGNTFKLDRNGNVKYSKTSRIVGWEDANGNEMDFKNTPITESITVYPKFKFDWQRVAAVGIGVAIGAAAVVNIPTLATPAIAASVTTGVGSFAVKAAADHNVIKPQKITGVKVPYDELDLSDKLKYIKNHTIKNRYFWDTIMHLGLGSAIGGVGGFVWNKLHPEPDPEPTPINPQPDPQPDPIPGTVNEDVEVFNGIDHSKGYIYYENGNGTYTKVNELNQWIGDGNQTLKYFDDAGKEIIVGETPVSDITGYIHLKEVQNGIISPQYASGTLVSMGAYDPTQIDSVTKTVIKELTDTASAVTR